MSYDRQCSSCGGICGRGWCERENVKRPARKPLTDYQIRQIDELVWKELSYEEKTFGQFALKMAKAIERAHGIGE